MARPTAARWGRRAALPGVLLAGGALRFATLGLQSLWFDEAATARLMRMSFHAMLRGVSRSESTPPLFYVLEWLWTRPFGTGPVALRSLSALAGTLTIVVVYLAARALLDGAGETLRRRGALAASALVAFNPLLIWYSQEARAYALLVLLIAAGLWALPGAARGQRQAVLLWAVAGALALATHYFAVFIVAPELVWLVWRSARGRALGLACGVIGLTAVALVPLAAAQRARGGARFITQLSLPLRLAQLPKQLLSGYAAPGEVTLTVLAILAALVGLALAWRSRRQLPPILGAGWGTSASLAGLAVLAVALPLALALAGWDYFITRNLIATLVPLLLVLAIGMTRNRLGAAALTTLCAVGVVASVGVAANVRYQRQDWRDAAASIPHGGPTAVIVSPAAGVLPLSYYRRGIGAMPASAVVGQVEVILFAPRAPGDGSTLPSLPASLPTLSGFEPPRVERYATFLVVRYLPSAPGTVVAASALYRLAFGEPGGTTARLVRRQ
jgi:4-amino-4-deoxy-L-arabinose transferase-like glycosyltransferase